MPMTPSSESRSTASAGEARDAPPQFVLGLGSEPEPPAPARGGASLAWGVVAAAVDAVVLVLVLAAWVVDPSLAGGLAVLAAAVGPWFAVAAGTVAVGLGRGHGDSRSRVGFWLGLLAGGSAAAWLLLIAWGLLTGGVNP